MTPKINRRGQYVRTDISPTARLVVDRYDRPQIKLNSQSRVPVQPSTEEESDDWVAQQMFDHYNGQEDF